MSKYIKREWLSEEVGRMIDIAKESKSRVGVGVLNPYRDNEYWVRWVDKVTRSLEHYCDTAGIFIDVNPFDYKYTIGQLEVIKFILDRRRNCGNKVL